MSIPLLRGVLPSLYALHVYSTRLQMQKAKWRRGGDITCIFNDQPKPRNATGTKPPIIPRVGDPLVKINRPRLHHKIRYRYYKQRKAWFYYQLPFSLPFFFSLSLFFLTTHIRENGTKTLPQCITRGVEQRERAGSASCSGPCCQQIKRRCPLGNHKTR